MKIIIYYLAALALAWAGLNSLMVAVAYWPTAEGTLAALLAGALMVYGAARLLVKSVRLYFPQSREGGLED